MTTILVTKDKKIVVTNRCHYKPYRWLGKVAKDN
jgi:hypothetical protein